MRDDDIDDLAGKLEELDELLHGQRSKTDSGLVGQVNQMQTELNAITRVLFPDHTGRGGFLGEFNEIKRSVHKKEVNSEYRWKFWTAIAVALITSLGLLLQNWPAISASWRSPRTDPVGKMIERTKHPRKKVYRLRRVSPPPEPLLRDFPAE